MTRKAIMKALLTVGLASVVQFAQATPPPISSAQAELDTKAVKKQQPPPALPKDWQQRIEVGKPLDDVIYANSEVIAEVNDIVTLRLKGKIIRVSGAERTVQKVYDTF